MSTGSESATRLLQAITTHYLESEDFNGLLVTKEMSKNDVEALIASGLVCLNRGDRYPNPHIKAISPEPIDAQIAKIASNGLDGCLYPEPAHLKTIVDPSQFTGRPFTLALALGEPQLTMRTFDPQVLESYLNDPRYLFVNHDFAGMISVRDDGGSIEPRHRALIQTFGFAFDEEFNRAVAVYLRYLHDLTPEHQRLWEVRLVAGDFVVHPDYYKTSIMGEWADNVPIHVAFLEELHQINALCGLMGRAPLFREEFRDSERPIEFAFLLRPTLRAFNGYVHVLDKMLSDNINDAFFSKDISRVRQVTRKDGAVVEERKGSIQLLEEWLTASVRLKDPTPRDNLLATFRKIRKLRQHPAHAVTEDMFDQAYFKRQRDLLIEAYTAVRTIRLILANHPATKAHEVPAWLYLGHIRTF